MLFIKVWPGSAATTNCVAISLSRRLGLVWRCIYLDEMHAYTDAVLRFLQLRCGTTNACRLKVRYECRPYELGWLLYAWAGR